MTKSQLKNPLLEVEPKEIPDGVYDGIWGGYNVKVFVGDKVYWLTSDIGIRTTASPCVITKDDCGFTVETKEERK